MFNIVTTDTLAPLLLRLGVGAFFIAHGLEKVSLDHDWGFTWANSVSDPPTPAFQAGTAWGELVAGVLLAAGFFTRPAALVATGLTILLAAGGLPIDVAATSQAIVKGEGVYNIALVGACAALVFLGGGNVALDQVFRMWRKA
jgi:uncharacterized membrane protein YphA (DoxX/SURF4 family)